MKELLDNPQQVVPDCLEDALMLEEPLTKLFEQMYEAFTKMEEGTVYILNDSVSGEEFKGNLCYTHEVSWRKIRYASFGICGDHSGAWGDDYGFNVKLFYRKKKFRKPSFDPRIAFSTYHDRNWSVEDGFPLPEYVGELQQKIKQGAPDKDKFIEYTQMMFRFPTLIALSRNHRSETIRKDIDELVEGTKRLVLGEK